MTVCIAAIGASGTIFGASDRMITADDIQYEPQQSKIQFLTNSIAVMVAGNAPLQTEVIYRVQEDVGKRVETEPGDWWRVADVAEMYQRYFQEAKRKRIETTYLAPLGLDSDSYITRQQQLEPNLVSKLATEMIDFRLPAMAAIITGVDKLGSHIYVVSNGEVSCQDALGFSAIGAGMWHASSQFMFAGHTRSTPDPATLYRTYSAKKRAETAPGVGAATDMLYIGPSLGVSSPIGEHVLVELDKIYQDVRGKERAIDTEANAKVNQYVEELGRTVAEEQEVKDEDGDKPAN